MAQEFEKRPDGMPLWKDVSGKNVSCTEKVKVLDENYRELRESVSRRSMTRSLLDAGRTISGPF